MLSADATGLVQCCWLIQLAVRFSQDPQFKAKLLLVMTLLLVSAHLVLLDPLSAHLVPLDPLSAHRVPLDPLSAPLVPLDP